MVSDRFLCTVKEPTALSFVVELSILHRCKIFCENCTLKRVIFSFKSLRISHRRENDDENIMKDDPNEIETRADTFYVPSDEDQYLI